MRFSLQVINSDFLSEDVSVESFEDRSFPFWQLLGQKFTVKRSETMITLRSQLD